VHLLRIKTRHKNVECNFCPQFQILGGDQLTQLTGPSRALALHFKILGTYIYAYVENDIQLHQLKNVDALAVRTTTLYSAKECTQIDTNAVI